MPRNRPRTLELRFPAAGVVRRLGYRASTDFDAPYPTPWAVNVRLEDPLARRLRGGSRTGLTKHLTGALGAVGGMVSVPIASTAGVKPVLAVLADGALSVADGSAVSTPTGILTTEAGVSILTEAGEAILVGSGSVPTGLEGAPADCYLVARRQRIFAIESSGVTVMDAATGVTDTLVATAGTVPAGCTFGAVHRDRLFLSGADNAIYASRQGDPADWDYGADIEDQGRAVAFQLAEASEIGEAPTALVPHRDAFLLAGTRNTLWAIQGDPAASGTLRNVSRTVGVVSAKAWCKMGESVIFLARDGLYRVAASGEDLTALSDDRIPDELRDKTAALIEYDREANGVWLFQPDGGHWFFDLAGAGFWPVRLQDDHSPTAVCRHDGDLILAGDDGYLRETGGDDDDGEDIESHVLLGPIRLGRANDFGMVLNLHGLVGKESGPLTWRIVTGNTAEAAAEDAKTAIAAFQAGTSYASYVKASGTWTPGRSLTAYPRVRAMWAVLWIQASEPWAYENITMEVTPFGRWR